MADDDTIVTQSDLDDLDGQIPLRDCVIVNLLTLFVEDARRSHPPIKAAVLAPDLSNSVYLTVVARQKVPRPNAELGPADLARPRIFGGADYDHLLMPLHTPGHWMLAILHRHKRSVTFFDPQQPLNDVPRLRQVISEVIVGVVAAVHGYDFQDHGVGIQVADYKSFTRQTDGYNCGVHVCLIAEHFVKGRVDLRVDNLDTLLTDRLIAERLRYRQLLCVTRPNLMPSLGRGTFPRYTYPAQAPCESTYVNKRAYAGMRPNGADDNAPATDSVLEQTKRGKLRLNKRSPIMNYFEQTDDGMMCPVCKRILTARNNKFNAGNLEQHLAKHPESDEWKRFDAEKAVWRQQEPQRSLIHLIPLIDRKRRSPIDDDAQKDERKRSISRAYVMRTRQRVKLQKLIEECAEYRQEVPTCPSPWPQCGIVDNVDTLEIKRVIGAFEQLYISGCATTGIQWFKSYQQGFTLARMADWMNIENTSLDKYLMADVGERLDTASALPVVGRPSDREFRFLAEVLRSGNIWPLINSVKRRLRHGPNGTYLKRLFGILASGVVNVAAVEIFSVDVMIDMSRQASQWFFTELNDYFTALKTAVVQSKADLSPIARFEQACFIPDQNTDDDTIREVFSTNEAVYQRRVFYNICSNRNPRISAALGTTYDLLPRQTAKTCQLRKRDALIEKWQTVTREAVWNPSLIAFKVDDPRPTSFESVSFDNLVHYAILDCTLEFRKHRRCDVNASECALIDHHDITSPSFIEGIKQLRAGYLCCRNFSESPWIYVKEITSLNWCLLHAQYIPHLVFDFTQMDQLLTCLTDLLEKDSMFPRNVTDVIFNFRNRNISNFRTGCFLGSFNLGIFLESISRFIRYTAGQRGWTFNEFKTHSFLEAVRLLFEVSNLHRGQRTDFELGYNLQSEELMAISADIRIEQRNHYVCYPYDNLKEFTTKLWLRVSKQMDFRGRYPTNNMLHRGKTGLLRILFNNSGEFLRTHDLCVEYYFT